MRGGGEVAGTVRGGEVPDVGDVRGVKLGGEVEGMIIGGGEVVGV